MANFSFESPRSSSSKNQTVLFWRLLRLLLLDHHHAQRWGTRLSWFIFFLEIIKMHWIRWMQGRTDLLKYLTDGLAGNIWSFTILHSPAYSSASRLLLVQWENKKEGGLDYRRCGLSILLPCITEIKLSRITWWTKLLPWAQWVLKFLGDITNNFGLDLLI